MYIDAKATRDFLRAFDHLQSQKQRIVREKIDLLFNNPRHPSLNVRKTERARAKTSIWECYIDEGMRVLFESSKGTMILWYLGGHQIVDDVHLHSFSATQFESWKSLSDTQLVTLKDPQSALPIYTPLELSFDSYNAQTVGTPNYFAYFRSSDLRILGVPEEHIQSVKEASTLVLQ